MAKQRARQRDPEVEENSLEQWNRIVEKNARRREGLDDESQPELPDQTLDEFLREVHQTSTLGDNGGAAPANESAMPSIASLKEMFKTKSAIIRHLHSRDFAVKDIAKHLGLRYQHVRNVLTTELKRGPNESFHVPTTSETE